jgi:polyisoprenyl-teichoic acid--peptidoglycan teichoic acid transferase
MRIPGWLIFIIGMIGFISMTLLCSAVSYSTTRRVVIDMRDNGVEVNLSEAIDFVIYGADAIEPTPFMIEPVAAQPTAVPTALPPMTATNTPPPGITFTPAPTATIAPTQTPDLMANLVITDPRRITVLLMGIDQRRALTGDERAYRTDTMMLVQVDPIRNTIGVLSIPRDLYVNIPDFEPGRINTANQLGDSYAMPGGGPQVAMDTIHVNLGVPVDQYVRINFEVFTSVVNTITSDGIEICVKEVIHDDYYPDTGNGTITVHFDPGCQQMDAEELLQYARTRATNGGDFDRNRRQQEVLKAVQAEVFNVGGVTHFISQIPVLYEQLAGSYTTNLSLQEILQLAQLVGTIPEENITFRTINNLHVNLATVEGPEGPQQVLMPVQDQIRFVVQDTFDPLTDLSLAELRQRAEAEDADIVIYNDTNIVGMAASTREWLTSQGVSIFDVGSFYPATNAQPITIRDYTGNPWTARYLAALFNLPDEAIMPGDDGETASDVMLVLGTNAEAFLAGQNR